MERWDRHFFILSFFGKGNYNQNGEDFLNCNSKFLWLNCSNEFDQKKILKISWGNNKNELHLKIIVALLLKFSTHFYETLKKYVGKRPFGLKKDLINQHSLESR